MSFPFYAVTGLQRLLLYIALAVAVVVLALGLLALAVLP